MGKIVKVLLSVVIVFGGLSAYGFIAVQVLGPERLAKSGFLSTVLLLVVLVLCGVALRFLWKQPKGGTPEGGTPQQILVGCKRPSKPTLLRIVGGVLLIAFALIGGIGNLGVNPVSNLSALLVMAVLILIGLKLIGIVDLLRSRKP